MKTGLFDIISNRRIAESIYELRLFGDTSDITAPGQFVNIKLNGFYLRRPISVCDLNGKELTLIYKTVGNGTKALSELTAGSLDIMTGLGNGYSTAESGQKPLLIGGGVGVPPMYMLAKKLCDEGKKPIAILGFNKKEESFYIDNFSRHCETLVATVDASVGKKGFVTDIISELKEYTYFYACGPEPMLKAVYDASSTSGQLSFEERMGCGFGACMGCSCKTKYGSKRICTDGPVLLKEEIVW